MYMDGCIRASMKALCEDILYSRPVDMGTLVNITRCYRHELDGAVERGVISIVESEGKRIVVPGEHF